MIQPGIIFPLAHRPLSWLDGVEASQDMRRWSVTSRSERSGDISGFYRPTKAFAVRIRCSMAARGVPAMPSTRSEVAGFGARFPQSDNASVIAQRPRTRCARNAPSMPTGRRSKRQNIHRAVVENAARTIGKPRATDALDRHAIAETLPSAVLPCPPFWSAPASMPKPRLTNSARPRTVVLRQASARIARLHLATAVADAIAVRLADNSPRSLMTHAWVAHARPGFPYSTHSLRAQDPNRRRQSLGDHP